MYAMSGWKAGARLLAAITALVLSVVLASCASSGGPAEGQESGDSSGAFPVTIEHKYGETTIESEPKKVVTLGLSDQDAVLALGKKPVGVVDWFKERPFGSWAWSKDAWGGTTPDIVGERDDYNMEKIAALEPDLIIAQYSGMKSEQYDKLSQIAPVVAQPKDHPDYQAPWQEMTTTIGKSLGKEDEAKKLISDIDKRFAKVREEHPEWQDKTVAVGEPYEPGTYSAFSPKDPKVAFLSEMGFTTTDKFQQALGNKNLADLSYERLDVMEADRTVWLTYPDTKKQLASDPLYKKLKVSKENRDLFLPYEDPDIGAALSYNTVLSIPYAIDQVVPMLEKIK